MKRTRLSFIAVVCATLVFLMSSCIGSFALSGGVLRWNNKLTNNKFVNQLVFLAMVIVPVYEITLFADAVLFNTIEFWSGNSILRGDVDTTVKGEHGEYHVQSTDNGYRIEHLATGEVASLQFDQQSHVWSIVQGTHAVELVKMIDENHVDLFYGDQVMNINNNLDLYAANN